MTGRPHCAATDLTTPSRRRGAPKDCWCTCRRTAQDRLFDDITALSAPGSRLATEYHPDAGASIGQRAEAIGDRWREHGFDVNLADLFYPGERNPVVEYLTEHGWEVNARTRPESVRGIWP